MELSIKERHKKYRNDLKIQLKETIKGYRVVKEDFDFLFKRQEVLTESELEIMENKKKQKKALDGEIADYLYKLNYEEGSMGYAYTQFRKNSSVIDYFLGMFFLTTLAFLFSAVAIGIVTVGLLAVFT